MAKRQLLMMGIRASFHTLAAVLVAGVIFTALFLSRNGMPKENPQSEGVSNMKEGEGSDRECNLFEGKWVFDNESNPIYREEECKFMSDQLACGKFGRKDSSYQYWRWQPHKCDLPRLIFFFIFFHFILYIFLSMCSLFVVISIDIFHFSLEGHLSRLQKKFCLVT